ncbi:MAG: hypothetical protein HPY89_01370 [Pelotomaculum sp.]|nr:hypothetical protein [Pelotomaculum sp.]
MLKELVEKGNALRGKETGIPLGYGERKNIDFVVDFYPDGRVEIIDAKKADIGIPPSPASSSRTNKVVPLPFIGQAAYLMGLSKKKNDEDRKASEKQQKYTELLNEMAASPHFSTPLMQEAISVLRHVRDSGEMLKRFRDEKKELYADSWVALRFQKGPLKDRYLFDTDETKKFWAEKTLEQSRSAHAYNCLICGKVAEIIDKLPGEGSPKIISINASSFVSYRVESKRAPLGICMDCADMAVKTFNSLQKKNRRWLVQDKSAGGMVNRKSFANIWAVYWLKKEATVTLAGAEVNPVDVLIGPLSFTEGLPVQTTGALVEKFLAVPWSGSGISANIDENDFYLMLISPNKARLIIRDMIHVTAAKAKSNLRRYVESLALEENDRLVTIEEIIQALQVKDGAIAKELVRTAYLGERLPPGVLQRAVNRIQRSALWRFSSPERPSGVKAYDYEKGRKNWSVLCALLKLYLMLRKGGAVPVEKQRERLGHLLGELFAVLEEAQRRSSGKTASTLTTRYFSAAMTTPTAVIPALVATAVKAYLPKIRRDSSGYTELETELERIMEEVDNSGGMPSILSMEQQAGFVLGFYSKRATFERHKKERMEKKQQEEVKKNG